MSNELLAALSQTGLTVTANVYRAGVLQSSGVACAEIGTTGVYLGSFPALAAGSYQIAFLVQGETVARAAGQIIWNGSAESPPATGAGAIQWTYTLTSDVDSSPIADADVWVTSDSAGQSVIASGRTDTSGQVTFFLDAATVFVWRAKSGWNFTNPDQEEVAA